MSCGASSDRAIRAVLALAVAAVSVACTGGTLRADPAALAAASPDLLARLKSDPYNYFRFINHEWTARVCDTFASELPNQPIVQLHGDAHIEQYALTAAAWGLDDFDDATRGPALVDLMRFLGSIDLAARRRGWTHDRDRLFDRFIAGYSHGLSEPSQVPAEPDIVRWLATHHPAPAREAFLASAETQMMPMPERSMNGLIAAMAAFAKLVQKERPELPDEYFRVVRAGWLYIGIGSASNKKILARVRGPSDDPADDELLEAKTLRPLDDLRCLEAPKSQPTFRVIVASRQLGRLKHSILAAGPDMELPEMTVDGEHLQDWWIRSWEPSYREVTLDDLRSVDDLDSLVYDSGVQLGAGSIRGATPSDEAALRAKSLRAIMGLDLRLRHEASTLVEQMLRGWREFGSR
jgi:hypothetical protein